MNIKKPTAYAEALITESMEQRLLMAHLRCPSTIRSLYAILSLPKQYRSAQGRHSVKKCRPSANL